MSGGAVLAPRRRRIGWPLLALAVVIGCSQDKPAPTPDPGKPAATQQSGGRGPASGTRTPVPARNATEPAGEPAPADEPDTPRPEPKLPAGGMRLGLNLAQVQDWSQE